MAKPGEVWNKKYSLQVKNYSGLAYGKKKNQTPTDIDGFIEWNDKLFIFVEIKYKTTKMDRGQEVALERLCDALEKAGKIACVMVAISTTSADEGPIMVDKLLIGRYRQLGRWHTPLVPTTVREAFDVLRKGAGISE